MTGTPRSTPDLEAVRSAYGSWAPAYIELFGSAEKASDADRARIGAWADGLVGPVLDAGCGPGHWTAFLRDRGVAASGVDATPAFVEHARRSRPDVPVGLGDLREVALADASLGGVLAWFSLIHLDPDAVPGVLRRFARALRPEGGLLLGTFTGPALRPFDHRVATAWAWPRPQLEAALTEAGFEVIDRTEAEAPNGRVHATTTARRRP